MEHHGGAGTSLSTLAGEISGTGIETMYDTILIPTDGSEGAEAAIEEGIGLARVTGATIHALSVVNDRHYGTIPDAEWVGINDALTTESKRAVQTVTARADRAGVEAVTDVKEGKPANRILEYADAEDVDCIVMGTHGRSGLDRLLLGSVAQRVVRHTNVPVHIVRVEDESDG